MHISHYVKMAQPPRKFTPLPPRPAKPTLPLPSVAVVERKLPPSLQDALTKGLLQEDARIIGLTVIQIAKDFNLDPAKLEKSGDIVLQQLRNEDTKGPDVEELLQLIRHFRNLLEDLNVESEDVDRFLREKGYCPTCYSGECACS